MARPNSRIPELAYPFAIVGFAAGWLSAGFLANPAVGVSTRGSAALAAGIAAVAAAGIGAMLTRLCVRRPDLPMGWPLALCVITGGAFTGGVVGAAEAGVLRGLPAGVLNGLLCALAFVPVCALVLAAARRAVRARLGSIVAESDRLAVWGILAATLAVATLAALPDWPAARIERGAPPITAVAMAVGAAVLLAAILVVDGIALVRVARLDRLPLEPREPGEDAADGVPAVDLGLGDAVSAQLAPRAGAAYRSRERAVALLLGSAGEARAALRRAVARSAAGLVLSAVVLVAHGWAASDSGAVAYGELRCGQGSARACEAAAEQLAQQLPDSSEASVTRPRELLRQACARGAGQGCAELSRLLATSPSPGHAAEARHAAEVACISGVTERCRSVADALYELDPAGAATYLRIGCGFGDEESCRLALAAGERAARSHAPASTFRGRPAVP